MEGCQSRPHSGEDHRSLPSLPYESRPEPMKRLFAVQRSRILGPTKGVRARCRKESIWAAEQPNGAARGWFSIPLINMSLGSELRRLSKVKLK